MWRFAVAAALLILLVVLVADMLFGGSRHLGTVDRYPPPLTWYGADREGRGTSIPSAGAVSRLSTASGSEGNALPAGTQLDQGLGHGDALHLEASLARQPIVNDREPWPGQVPPPPPPEPQPRRDDEPPLADERPKEAAHRPPGPAAPAQPMRAQIFEAQRWLAVLGYNPGPADGRIGRQTAAAVREFQRDIHQPETGRIDAGLLARLETEDRMRTHLRQQELEAMSPDPAPKPEKSPQDRGIFGTVLGGLQRLMGRNFDSVLRPEEITTYCRGNADTWIYDFGREAFIYCGNVLAGQTTTASTETPENR